MPAPVLPTSSSLPCPGSEHSVAGGHCSGLEAEMKEAYKSSILRSTDEHSSATKESKTKKQMKEPARPSSPEQQQCQHSKAYRLAWTIYII